MHKLRYRYIQYIYLYKKYKVKFNWYNFESSGIFHIYYIFKQRKTVFKHFQNNFKY